MGNRNLRLRLHLSLRARTTFFLLVFVPAVYTGCGRKETALPPEVPEQEVVSSPHTEEPFTPDETDQPALAPIGTAPDETVVLEEEPPSEPAAILPEADKNDDSIIEANEQNMTDSADEEPRLETQPVEEPLLETQPVEEPPLSSTIDEPDSASFPAATPPPAPEPPVVSEPPRPVVVFTSPSADSFYHSSTRITGRLTDSGGGPFPPDRIQNLSWSASHLTGRTDFSPDNDGSFSFDISTVGSRTDIMIEVLAETSDGFTAAAQLQLLNDRRGPFLEAFVVPRELPRSDIPAENPPASSTDTVNADTADDDTADDDTADTQSSLGTADGARLFIIRGRIADAEYDSDSVREVKSLMFREVGAEPEAFQLQYNDSGAFSLEIEAAESERLFELIAEDYHANQTRLIVKVSAVTGLSIGIKPPADTADTADITVTAGPAPQAAPVTIQLDSPLPETMYRSSISVSGKIRTEIDPLETEIRWDISGTGRTGSIAVDADGRFEDRIDTRGLTNTQMLRITPAAAAGIPIETETVTLLLQDDGTAPAVRIESPESGSFYEPVVTVSGRIEENLDGEGSAKEIEAAGWFIEGSDESGDLKINDDGTYLFRFSAIDLPDRISLVVWAEDFNKHRGEARSVFLNDGIGPHLFIQSPGKESYYTASVEISGAVWNSPESEGISDDVRGLFYEIEDSGEEPRFIFFEEDGSYQFQVQTQNFSGPVLLKITAEDTLGNREETLLPLRDGNLQPGIAISSPGESDPYGLSFYLRGTVTDPYVKDPGYGGIERVEYQISSLEYQEEEEPLSGSMQPDEAGDFSFQIDASGLQGAQQVTVSAIARNGNISTDSFTIVQGEVTIPDISVIQENGSLSIDWEEIPFTTEYAVHVSRVEADGDPLRLPVIKTRVPPVQVNNLQNGYRYSFFIETSVRGRLITSGEHEAIPMYPDMLKPKINADYQRLDLSWPALPGVDRYDVLRSHSSPEDGWEVIAENHDSNTYTDHAVSYGREYFYAVRPSGGIGVSSTIASAESLSAPAQKFEIVADVSSLHRGKLEIVGGYAFFAARDGGIHIVDITLPGSLEPIGTTASEGATDIAVYGDYAYVSEGERGYKIFNISDPRAPYEVSRRKTMQAEAVAVNSEKLYIADGPSGLKIIDISDPLYPNEVSRLQTGYARDIKIAGSFLFLLSEDGLRVYSTGKSDQVSLIGELDLEDPVSFCLEGQYAYMIEKNRGLAIADISKPEAVHIISRLSIPAAERAEVYNDFAYITSSEGGFLVVDVYDPKVPMIFEQTAGRIIDDMALSGSTLLSCGEAGLRRISTYLFGKSYNTGSYQLNATAHHINFQDQLIQVAQRASGLATIRYRADDTKNSGDTAIGGDAAVIPGFAASSTRWNGYTLVAAGTEGVKFFNDLLPDSIPAFTLSTDDKVLDVKVRGDIAAVSTGTRGVALYSLTDLSSEDDSFIRSITPVSTISSSDPRAVILSDNSMLIADYEGGLKLVDISSPARPEIISEIGTMNVKTMVLIENLLFAGGFRGIEVFDLSNPFSVKKIHTLNYPFVESLTTDGTYVYIAQGVHGVKVVDPWTSRGPRLVSSCEGIYAVDIAVSGGQAFVSSGTEVKIIEIVIPPWLESVRGRF